MELGGALGTVRDKIFVATGSEVNCLTLPHLAPPCLTLPHLTLPHLTSPQVRGFTKKGKMFLQVGLPGQ